MQTKPSIEILPILFYIGQVNKTISSFQTNFMTVNINKKICIIRMNAFQILSYQ